MNLKLGIHSKLMLEENGTDWLFTLSKFDDNFFVVLHVLYKLWTWILYTVLQIKSKHESVVRFWLKWRNYGSVSNSFSCTTWTQILELLFKSGHQRFFISLKFRSKHQNLMVHFSKLLSVTLRSGIEKPPRKHIVF